MDRGLQLNESIMLSLRTPKGIQRKKYLGDFNQLQKRAKTFEETEHLKITENKIQTTEKGFLIVDAITRKLII